MKFILIECESSLLHFGTSLGNNTNKMSSNIPSKSMIRGFVGSALGLDFSSIQDLDFYYSFQWLCEPNNTILSKNRMVYNSKSPNSLTNVTSVNWLSGEPVNTIDSVEYIYNQNGNLKFNILLSFFDDCFNYDLLVNCLYNPAYPLYLGSADGFVRIKKIDLLDLPVLFDESTFKDLFLGESLEPFLVKEILTDKMFSYRVPLISENIYTRHKFIKGICLNGYVSYNNLNYCLW